MRRGRGNEEEGGSQRGPSVEMGAVEIEMEIEMGEVSRYGASSASVSQESRYTIHERGRESVWEGAATSFCRRWTLQGVGVCECVRERDVVLS